MLMKGKGMSNLRFCEYNIFTVTGMAGKEVIILNKETLWPLQKKALLLKPKL